jgi:S-DNA-T family DNA segregation ATPase FtsK/SpoIIIE
MEFTDERYEEAKSLVLSGKCPCIATIQRRLQIGYNRASRIMEALVANGVLEEVATERGSSYRVAAK